jgi:hypothetical protein
MNRLETQPAPSNVHRSGAVVRAAVIVVLLAAVLAGSLLLVRDRTFVPRVTIDNPTALALDVDIAASTRDGWVPAGVAAERGATAFHEVLDHGDEWAFRFTNGDGTAVLRVSRDDLARNGWRVEVPASIAERLAAG